MTFDAPTAEQMADETITAVDEAITPENESQAVESDANDTLAETPTPPVPPTPAAESDDDLRWLLEEIYQAEQECRACDKTVEALKAELKDAKERLNDATIYLRKMASKIHDRKRGEKLDQERPLLAMQQEEQPAATADAWRSIPTSVLLEEPIERFGAKKQELLLDAVPTLGDFVDLQCRVGKDAATLRELLPKGIGEAAADALEERLITAVRKYQITDEQPAEQQSTEAEEFPGNYETQITAMAEEILTDWETLATPIGDREIWRLGFSAYIDQQELKDCCWAPGSDKQRDWVIGWLTAYQEDEATEDPLDEDSDDGEGYVSPEKLPAVSLDDL